MGNELQPIAASENQPIVTQFRTADGVAQDHIDEWGWRIELGEKRVAEPRSVPWHSIRLAASSRRSRDSIVWRRFYLSRFVSPSAAWAAASRAIGTRKGEQLT